MMGTQRNIGDFLALQEKLSVLVSDWAHVDESFRACFPCKSTAGYDYGRRDPGGDFIYFDSWEGRCLLRE